MDLCVTLGVASPGALIESLSGHDICLWQKYADLRGLPHRNADFMAAQQLRLTAHDPDKKFTLEDFLPYAKRKVTVGEKRAETKSKLKAIFKGMLGYE